MAFFPVPCREDIPLAAVDFHVAPALTQHLKEQPQLKAAVRGMISTSPAGESVRRSGGLPVCCVLWRTPCVTPLQCLQVDHVLWHSRLCWLVNLTACCAAVYSIMMSSLNDLAAYRNLLLCSYSYTAACLLPVLAVAARLSGPDGFEGLINSTIWQLRSSINRKAWIQYQYIQHLPSAAGAGGQVLNRQLLEAAAVAAVSAWSCAGHALAPGDTSTDSQSARTHPAGASNSAATTSSRQLLAVASGGPATQLPPGTGFSEGALRVLEMEVSGVVAFEAEQRRLRQELLPLWKAGLASLADAWCREFLSRRVY